MAEKDFLTAEYLSSLTESPGHFNLELDGIPADKNMLRCRQAVRWLQGKWLI